MIKKSFIFLDKVGSRTEQKLWESGVTDWKDFLRNDSVPGFSRARKMFHNAQIVKAHEALQNNDHRFFSKHFPRGEMWRVYDFFSEETCFLDIETSGYYGDVTVVGMYDGNDTKIMVKGVNLDGNKLKEELARYKLLVTFNGSSFDLPVLEKYYPGCIPDVPHLDLRHACRKLNLVGGLKKIEKELGIKRGDDVQNMDGSEAVYLWNMWRSTGEQKYIDLLVKYNEEDIINLKPIAEYCYTRLKSKVFNACRGPNESVGVSNKLAEGEF